VGGSTLLTAGLWPLAGCFPVAGSILFTPFSLNYKDAVAITECIENLFMLTNLVFGNHSSFHIYIHCCNHKVALYLGVSSHVNV
jgi:hypothetical protein